MPFKPTYLYTKEHKLTGLKYFGKTIKNPYEYSGSGTYWLRHLKKYGNDVTTTIVGYYTDETQCKEAALNFSKSNNIVESKEWANLCDENGTDGGYRPNNHLKYLNTLPKTENFLKRVSEANKGNQHRAIKISINGIEFNSMIAASKYFSVSEQAIYRWIKSGRATRL